MSINGPKADFLLCGIQVGSADIASDGEHASAAAAFHAVVGARKANTAACCCLPNISDRKARQFRGRALDGSSNQANIP